MKVHDNRHLDYSDLVQIGDLIITTNGYYFMFVSELGNKVYDVAQIDLNTFEIVDRYSKDTFYQLKVGYDMPYGGEVKEIVKSKNLVLDLRK